MPDSTRRRPGQEAVLPDDVTDPLLWRLALDVASAHRPDATGRCGNPDCADQAAPCGPLRQAERAMDLARATAGPAARVDTWEPTTGGRPAQADRPAPDPATEVLSPTLLAASARRAA